MSRKTVKIEIVVDDEMTIYQKRELIRDSIASVDFKSPYPEAWSEVLSDIGWSGNPGAIAVTVSNPRRTKHWNV